jgi:hypothetical protein
VGQDEILRPIGNRPCSPAVFCTPNKGGYIAALIPYIQGAYKTGPAPRTSPGMEDVLISAISHPLITTRNDNQAFEFHQSPPSPVLNVELDLASGHKP